MKIIRDKINGRNVHFPWIIIWNVTNHCNLNCFYCFSNYNLKQKEDYVQAKETLLKLNPKSVVLFGGEPLLNPILGETITALKKQNPNIFISLNTNGILIEKILPIIKYIDRVSFSIDGINSTNNLNRGVNGKVLFKKLVKLVSYSKKYNIDVITNTVITSYNYKELPQLIELVKNLDNDISMFFYRLIPEDHKLSIRNNLSEWEWWTKQFYNLQTKYTDLWMDGDLRHSIKTSCLRQFFLYHMDPSGNLYSCRQIEKKNILKNLLAKESMSNINRLKSIWSLLNFITKSKYSISCEHSCDWFLSLENFLLGKNKLSQKASRIFQAGFEKKEIEEVTSFINNRLNSDFRAELLFNFKCDLTIHTLQ